MRTNIYILLIGLLGLFTACKKELPFPDANSKAQLVLNSLFSPDSTMMVHISESCHIQDTSCGYMFIPDAEVRIKEEGGNSWINLRHQERGVYMSPSLTIESNKAYQIEVKKLGYETASAKSKTPQAISAEYIGFEEGIYENRVAWGIDIKIEDDPNEENYYILQGYIDMEFGEHDDGESEINGYIEPHTLHFTNDINAENRQLSSGYDIEIYGLRSIFLPDKNFNGQSYQTGFAIKDRDTEYQEVGALQAHVTVKSVCKEMYEYEKSLEKNRLSQGNLFAEPEQIISNISQGLGVFAGFTQQEYRFDLPLSDYRLPSDIFIENEGCVSPCIVKFSTDGGPLLAYSWDFGDGGTSSEPSPEHEYKSPGNYQVVLSLSESIGDISSWSMTIEIK